MELLKQADIEKRYNISRYSLYRWINKGLITEYRTGGGHRRYDPDEVDAVFGVKNGKPDLK